MDKGLAGRPLPSTMSDQTIAIVARRAAEHVRASGLPSLHVVLHGGEPLLAGAETIERSVKRIRAAVGDAAVVQCSVQTNGTRLSPRFLELFRQLAIGVGVSLDGDQIAHDRNRRWPGGSGSYRAVATSLRLLGNPRYRHLFAGLLGVIDLRNDPVAAYRGLLEFSPPIIDFLLPYGNWQKPPPGLRKEPTYGQWLAKVFDHWYAEPIRQTRIRLFEEIMSGVLGGTSRLEGIGLSPIATVIVDTDGSIGDSDLVALGSADRRPHVTTDPLAAAVGLPGVAESRLGAAGLCQTCQRCEVHPICGGGLHAHRYRQDSGYANPSIYCADLRFLITHIHARLARDIEALSASPTLASLSGRHSTERHRAVDVEEVAGPGRRFRIRPGAEHSGQL